MALEKSIIGPSGATTMYHKVQDMTYSAGSVRVRVGHYVDEASRRAGFDPVHTTRTGIQLIEKQKVVTPEGEPQQYEDVDVEASIPDGGFASRAYYLLKQQDTWTDSVDV